MLGRLDNKKDNMTSKFTKKKKVQEIVDTNNHPRSEET